MRNKLNSAHLLCNVQLSAQRRIARLGRSIAAPHIQTWMKACLWRALKSLLISMCSCCCCYLQIQSIVSQGQLVPDDIIFEVSQHLFEWVWIKPRRTWVRMYTYAHTYTPAHTYTRAHARAHMHRHIYTHTHMRTRKHTNTRTRAHTRTHAQTHTSPPPSPHTQTHIYTHAHAHAHTQAYRTNTHTSPPPTHTLQLLHQRLSLAADDSGANGSKGFILDGFPRTRQQVSIVRGSEFLQHVTSCLQVNPLLHC